MPYTDLDLRTDVGVRIRDTTEASVSKSTIRSYAHASLRRLVRHHDIPSGRYKTGLKLYKGIFRYALPSSYHDFISIINGETIGDNLNFDRIASEEEFFRDYPTRTNRVSHSNDGISKFLLVNLTNIEVSNVLLHNCDTINGNGTWEANTTGSDAANLRTDSIYTTDGTGSLAFDVIVAQSANDFAEVLISDLPTVDLTSDALYQTAGLTLDLWLPRLPSELRGFTLRFGEDASNYYQISVTSQAGGAPFTAGKNVLVFDWSQTIQVGNNPLLTETLQDLLTEAGDQLVTETGTVSDGVSGNISYLSLRMFYDPGMDDIRGVRIDNIWARQPFIATLLYSSYYLILDQTTNAPKEKIENDGDIINIDTPYIDILLESVLKRVFTYHVEDDYMRGETDDILAEAENDIDERFPATRQPASSTHMEEANMQDFLL